MFRLAGLYSNLAAYDKAIALFQEFVRKWPEHPLVPEALYQLASVYADEKQFPEMIESLREYVKRCPNHTHVADALYAIGTQLEAQKKTDEAMATYRDLIARAAANRPLTGPWRDAVIGAQLRIAALLDPSSALADCESFLAHFAGDPTAARAMVSQIAALYRKDKELNAGYVKLDQLAQQYQANSAVRVACATSTIELALADKDFGRATAAATELLAVSEREKLPATSYLALGDTFLKTGQFQPARENFEKVLALYRNDSRLLPAARLGLGQAMFSLKQYDAAEAALRNATGVDVDLTLAKIYEATGRLKEAVDLYNQVMQSGRGEISSEAAYRLGNFFFNHADPAKSGDNKQTALAYYVRLLFATGPMAEEAAYRAGECHEALGNLSQACATFQAYVKRFPTGQFVASAKSKIARLCAPPPL
jgi:TolA-binding protein